MTAAPRIPALVTPLDGDGSSARPGDDGGARSRAARPTSAIVERNVAVPMRDGTILRADVYRPGGPGRYPVLVQRLPYGKGDSGFVVVASALEPLRAAEAGFVVVVQDVRGRGASDGRFTPFEQETADGADTVAWAAAQPFSDGRVGMYGVSYAGATQLLAAVEAPPALAAVAPHFTAAEYYDGWTYQGGAFQLGFSLLWAGGFAGDTGRRSRAVAGGRPAEADGAGRDGDIWQAYRHLPLLDHPALVEGFPAYREWLCHPERDGYWRRTAVNERYGRVRVPALHIAGWYDLFLGGTLANYRGLRDHAATPRARAAQRLVIGPWTHSTPSDHVGDAAYGPAAGQFSLDMTGVHLDWFAAVLAGREADIAPVRLFVMGANRWRDEDDWPLTRARPQPWYLRGGGYANGLDGDGWLSPEPPPVDEPPDRYLFDPRNPVPTLGGPTFLPGHSVGRHAGPRDQRPVERRHDVLVYTSAPLPHDVEVTGPLSVTLHAATSARDTDWTAKLVDVHPDGRALSVVDGILRARYHRGLDRAQLLDPHRPYEYTIDLVATSTVFRAGHRLRVEISSSNFPRFDRNPNHGGDIASATSADLTPAVQTVFHDAARPSCIRLPIVRAQAHP